MGGAEVWLMELLEYFSKSGDSSSPKFDVLLTSGERSVFDREAEQLGATLHYARFGMDRMRAFRQEFKHILETGSFDAIHDHQGLVAGIHFLLAPQALPPVRIAHFHNPRSDLADAVGGWRASARERVGMFGTRLLATHILGTSLACLDEYGISPVQSSRATVAALHCGFDTSRFSFDREASRARVREEFNWPADSRIALFVGRLGSDNESATGEGENRKNPRFALEVVRRAIAIDPSVRMLLAGGGESKRREYAALAAEWGLSDKIVFAGTRSDVAHLMAGSDLLVFPSTSEGLGMVAVEAQAAGLPVLASTAVPAECVVIDGMVTFLPLSVGTDKWAESAASIIAMPPVDAERCRKAVEQSNFSVARSAAALSSIYCSAGQKGAAA